MQNVVDERAVEAAVIDAEQAIAEFDGAVRWLAAARQGPMEPLAAEVWVFDKDLAQVVLVKHRWRGWVPPGGKVEAGETPREGAARELFEETGLQAELLPEPAAVAVRSYHPDWPVTLGLSYAAVVDAAAPFVPEAEQPVIWKRLDEDWESYFPDDLFRIRQCAAWLAIE
ncbi:NUDIX domain-containing protein [Streptomyces sp. NPDC002577]